MAIITNNIIFAVSLGLLPPLIWLWFWLREDSRPEPQSVLLLTFFSGMAVTFLVLPLEYAVLEIQKSLHLKEAVIGGMLTLFVWAFIEEVLKYFAAKEAALNKNCCDEPIDVVIYLITAALGFAAMENIFFLFKAGASEGLMSCFIVGNLRFLGATLLHTATSAILGASIAFSFFHKENIKRNIIGGILLATVLHFIFNFLIINSEGKDILKILIPLWALIIVVIFIFEKVKRIKK